MPDDPIVRAAMQHPKRLAMRMPPNGDSESSRMIADCQERVFRLALRITRNQEDAEDSRQEALLKAYRHISQFEGRSQFTTWISRIAINEALMNLRKRHRAIHETFEDAIGNAEATQEAWAHSSIEGPDRAYARKELRHTLQTAIDRLRPNYRSVFLMRAVEDLSTSETARSLGISVSAVKTRMRRARRELQGILQAGKVASSSRRAPSTFFSPKPERATGDSVSQTWVA
jgi:RNA polymerase sigma-70 factor (ECF subfamily)